VLEASAELPIETTGRSESAAPLIHPAKQTKQQHLCLGVAHSAGRPLGAPTPVSGRSVMAGLTAATSVRLMDAGSVAQSRTERHHPG